MGASLGVASLEGWRGGLNPFRSGQNAKDAA